MSTLEFSPNLMADLPKNVVFPTAGAVTLDASSINLYPMLPKNFDVTGIGELEGYIKIMQGVVPTNFNTLPQTTSRDTDVLITYTIDDTTVFDTFSNFNTNPLTIETTYQTASNTGTATWFWWVVTEPEANSNIVGHQIVGTIGNIGSGSDLEMLDPNIVAGKYYRISNLKFFFPNSYTTP